MIKSGIGRGFRR